MAKQITTIDFIGKSNEIHKSKYTYNKTIYVKSIEKVIITCKEHGDFEQTPQMHLRGSGCSRCSTTKAAEINRKNLTELLEECNKIHQSKYGYNFKNYTSVNKKYEIICPKHGSFMQRLSSHLSGVGCKKCGKTKTTQQFIEDAKLVHNDKFDYSAVEYVNSHNKINIICRQHGIFSMRPYSHLSGRGCPTCAAESRVLTLKRDENIFSKSGYKTIADNRECTFYILRCFNDFEEFYKIRNYCIDNKEKISL